MGTKNNPGPYDCYANAEPDEPIFILRGKDPSACLTVILWVRLQQIMGTQSEDKLLQARNVAREMELWGHKLGKADEYKKVTAALNTLITEGQATIQAEANRDAYLDNLGAPGKA